MQFNDLTSITRYLKTRRSGRPRDMVAPGPDTQQLRAITQTAMRTPDHGKLAPWRVVHVTPQQRQTLSRRLIQAYSNEKPQAGRLELETMQSFAHQAPQLVVILFSPRNHSTIPLWEQELSCGAFCMNFVHAVHNEGFVAGWITGWPCYNDAVRDMFGAAPERIAGFIFVGTPKAELEERPRPVLENVFSTWSG
jgi:nitroreductase